MKFYLFIVFMTLLAVSASMLLMAYTGLFNIVFTKYSVLSGWYYFFGTIFAVSLSVVAEIWRQELSTNYPKMR